MKLVILDRDGVINEDSDDYIKTADEWIALPGSLEAIADLSQSGYQVVVATNQSGIGRGLFDMAALNAMHGKMATELSNVGGKVSAIFFCPHVPADNCDCRKPRPGLFHEIAKRFDVPLTDVPAVGDSLRDLQAGIAAGCQPHLVKTGKGLKVLAQAEEHGGIDNILPGTMVHENLAAFVDYFLTKQQDEDNQPIS